MSVSSSFAWPVFLGNLGLGSGWPRLGSGGPDVDDDITNRFSQTIEQHNGKLLLRVLFCGDMAGVLSPVLSDVASIGIGISWDSLIHCWEDQECKIG